MSWVDDNLTPGETVIYRAKNSWSVILEPIWFKPWRVAFGIGSENKLFRILTIPLRFLIWVFIGLFSLPSAIAAFQGNERVVTSDRVIAVNKGLIRRETMDIDLNDVESVFIKQGLWDKVFNRGILSVESATHGLELYDVPNPMEFQRQVLAAVDTRQE